MVHFRPSKMMSVQAPRRPTPAPRTMVVRLRKARKKRKKRKVVVDCILVVVDWSVLFAVIV